MVLSLASYENHSGASESTPLHPDSTTRIFNYLVWAGIWASGFFLKAPEGVECAAKVENY